MRTYRVTGTYALGDGGAYPEGRMVEFRPVVRGVSDGVIVLPQPVVAPIVGGNLSVDLVASAGEDWWWRVREPGEPDRHFDLAGDFDLAELESRLPPYVQVVGTPSGKVPTDSLRWRGSYPDAAPPYAEGDMVRDGQWLMTALRETSARPAPVSTGLPVWLLEGKTPEAHTGSSQSVLAGLRITVDSRFALAVKTARVWVVDANLRHTLWLVTNSTSLPEWNRVDFTPSTTGWVEVPIDAAVMLPGMIFDAIVEVTSTTGAATYRHVWNYNHSSAGVTPPAAGEVVMSPAQPDLMLIHDQDASLVDRSALLKSLRPGDTITARDKTYTVIDSVRELAQPYQRLFVAPAGVVSGIDRPSTEFALTTHLAGAAAVGKIPMHWLRPWLDETITGSGLYSETGRTGLTDGMDAWGVDLTVRKVLIPEDWAVMASGIGTASSSAGDSLAQLKTIVAASTDFNDFKSRIAAL